MVTTTLNTFCSVTVQCARCHNHKFDPIEQEHYYSLQSVFSALDRADRPYDTNPETSELRTKLSRHLKQLSTDKRLLEAAVRNAAGDRLLSIDEEIAHLEKQKTEKTEKPEFGYHSKVAAKQNVTKWVQIDLGESFPIAEIRYVGCHDDFAGIGHGFGFPKRYKIEASDDPAFRNGVELIVDHTKEDVPNPGTTPQSVCQSVSARFVRFTATKLTERSNDFIFALAELIVLNGRGENVAYGKTVTSLDSIEAPVRWRRKNLVDGYFFGIGSDETVHTRLAALRIERSSLIGRTVSKSLRAKLDANIALAQRTSKQLEALPKPQMVYAGTIHTGQGAFTGTGATGGKPRPIHVLHRGNIQSPRNPVGPGTIPIIPDVDWRFDLPESHGESERRVALANWITHHDNPLTGVQLSTVCGNTISAEASSIRQTILAEWENCHHTKSYLIGSPSNSEMEANGSRLSTNDCDEFGIPTIICPQQSQCGHRW